MRHLRAAIVLVDDTEENELDTLRLKSRIANSLAEQLSYGNDDEHRQAKEYFNLSISIKKREDIRDTEGLAFAYGGLGRLSFFAAKPDYETARKHFQQDLIYSKLLFLIAGKRKILIGINLYQDLSKIKTINSQKNQSTTITGRPNPLTKGINRYYIKK